MNTVSLSILRLSKRCFPLIFLAGLAWHCAPPAPPGTQKTARQTPPEAVPATRFDTSSGGVIVELETMLREHSLPPSDTFWVSYDEHFARKNKGYTGFPIAPFLQSILRRYPIDTANLIVHFECTDGYTPTMPIHLVLGLNKGYIADRALDAQPGKNWAPADEAKFSPFYLVWDGLQPHDHRYMWPYGLIRIKVLPLQKEFKNVYPYDNPEMVEAFHLFNQNCMKCHSINQVGGGMGPELNFPKNITEYWTEANIVAFAKNPQSFRISSKMPPVPNVSDAELAEIVRYLRFMARHKGIE